MKFGPQCWDLDLVATIKSAPRSLTERDAVDMVIMQRHQHNPTNLDTDANMVVSNRVTLSKALLASIVKQSAAERVSGVSGASDPM